MAFSKGKDIDQWNRLEIIKVKLHEYFQMIFIKVKEQLNRKRIAFLKKWSGGIRQSYRK
jgi:hypothetical protein